MQLHRDRQEVIDRGFTLVAIGQGTPARSAQFRQELDLQFPILADRELQAYQAYGLGRVGIRDMINPKLYLGGVRALLAGSTFSKPTGDTYQLPGTFIVDSRGVVRYAKPATIASDLASTAELIAWIDSHSP